MSFLAGIVVGAALALMVSWYIRHPDERATAEEAKEIRLNRSEEDEREKEEHERVERERRRQFEKLMAYTGANQKK